MVRSKSCFSHILTPEGPLLLAVLGSQGSCRVEKAEGGACAGPWRAQPSPPSLRGWMEFTGNICPQGQGAAACWLLPSPPHGPVGWLLQETQCGAASFSASPIPAGHPQGSYAVAASHSLLLFLRYPAPFLFGVSKAGCSCPSSCPGGPQLQRGWGQESHMRPGRLLGPVGSSEGTCPQSSQLSPTYKAQPTPGGHSWPSHPAGPWLPRQLGPS